MQRHLDEARAADGVLDHSQMASRVGGYDDRGIAKRWVEIDVVVGCVKTGMVEDVEELSCKPEREPLRQLGVLIDRKVPAILKWAAERIPANVAEAGFRHVANGAIAWGYTIGSRRDYRSSEGGGI